MLHSRNVDALQSLELISKRAVLFSGHFDFLPDGRIVLGLLLASLPLDDPIYWDAHHAGESD